VETSATSVKFHDTVVVSETGFTDSGWQVTGTITVTNPNDWEDITVNVGDAINNGGVCVVTGGTNQVVLRSASISPTYTCTYASAPSPAAFTNTATATWDKTAASTPDASASGTATGSFASVSPKLVNQTVTPTDSFNGGTGVKLCTLDTNSSAYCTLTAVDSTPYTTHIYKYSRTVNNTTGGSCISYTNTAVTGLTGTGQSSSQTVTVCNTATGTLTMGFWKNSQGQGVIKSYCGGTSGTSLQAFLTSYNPFKDDTSSGCSNQASYVYTVINKATCTSSTSTCNTMLRAQMLATALDVYFSTGTLGGNKINAKVALGGVVIDLSHICNMADSSNGSTCTGTYEDARPEFGIAGAPCLGTTVGEMLSYANVLSSVNGSPVATAPSGATWYNQLKGRQVFAKDGFDDTNNQIANIVPSGPGVCHPSF